jgi:hypothetical protein
VEGQLSSSIRILIADDFRGWRLQNRLLLQARPEWQVIAEASDGSDKWLILKNRIHGRQEFSKAVCFGLEYTDSCIPDKCREIKTA